MKNQSTGTVDVYYINEFHRSLDFVLDPGAPGALRERLEDEAYSFAFSLPVQLTEDVTVLAQEAYEIGNDPDHPLMWIAAQLEGASPLRSMSVGDLVIVNRYLSDDDDCSEVVPLVGLICVSAGWAPTNPLTRNTNR